MRKIIGRERKLGDEKDSKKVTMEEKGGEVMR